METEIESERKQTSAEIRTVSSTTMILLSTTYSSPTLAFLVPECTCTPLLSILLIPRIPPHLHVSLSVGVRNMSPAADLKEMCPVWKGDSYPAGNENPKPTSVLLSLTLALIFFGLRNRQTDPIQQRINAERSSRYRFVE